MNKENKNLRKNPPKPPVAPLKIGKFLTGRRKTTFSKSMRNVAFLLSFIFLLVLILMIGNWISQPKVSPITKEAIKIAREVAALPETAVGDIAYDEELPIEGDWPKLKIKTLSDIEAEEALERARKAQILAAAKKAEEEAKRVISGEQPKEELGKKPEEEKEFKRDAFGFGESVRKGYVGAVKAISKVIKPTPVSDIKPAPNVSNISVWDGDTKAAFSLKSIGKPEKKEFIPRPTTKRFFYSNEKIERTGSAIPEDIRGTGKAEEFKSKLIKAGKVATTGKASDALTPTKAVLEGTSGAEAPSGKKGRGGGLGPYGARGRGYIPPPDFIEALEQIKFEFQKKKDIWKAQFDRKQKLKNIPADVAVEVFKEIGKGLAGVVGEFTTGFLEMLFDVSTSLPKWVCQLDYKVITPATLTIPATYAGPSGKMCQCVGYPTKAKKGNAPELDQLIDQCDRRSKDPRVQTGYVVPYDACMANCP